MLYENRGPFRTMVDVEKGVVDRSIFADQDIYELELERIFARAWNFMCHESQIPKAGDFFLSFIGEESVIATRDKKGELQVLLNSCRHRGNAVCRAESGNARSFLCTYHGWTYGLDGQLIGVPGYKDFYHEQLDKSQWGLVKAGKVASYKGFVFATMDPEAPDLEEYLGEVGRMGLDLLAHKGEALVAVDGVQKNLIGCNWKLAVDNLFDWYHPQISHASANMADFRRQQSRLTDEERELAAKAGIAGGGGAQRPHRVVMGAYGHAIGGPRLTQEARDARQQLRGKIGGLINDEFRETPAAKEALGEVGADTAGHPNIFPNLWMTNHQLSLRLPRGPGQCEIWWFTFVPKEATEERREEIIHGANHVFGPAGMLEQDDGENWDQSTRAMRGVVAQRYPLNFAMGLGQHAVQQASDTSYIDTLINEHAQLWTYRAWAEWMDAESWAALKENHSVRPAADSRP
ncbi:aromatic ring-hydroxylating oxygenase subunit alpha [Phenylobacterium immobile]|uniref:aromatic ring-hydroxylating oxygenase subunit alpha n=1 Tax=Phenylobacterium immobile TaxID=21 RepID=UPI000B1ABBEF|nr:aromatic ring-hydroxylating dioxygenase subunit alpha [Phenylobacterium immobile]